VTATRYRMRVAADATVMAYANGETWSRVPPQQEFVQAEVADELVMALRGIKGACEEWQADAFSLRVLSLAETAIAKAEGK
jgi:predicted xylose isomerase-like sugar epimerase